MCFRQPRPKAPPPAPLAPPPPPPAPPTPPLPEADPIDQEVNPQVRRTKSQKDKNPYAKGTGALRIKLDPQVNTAGQGTPGGGGVSV